MSDFRSSITQGPDGRWIVTTGNLKTIYEPTDKAAAVQIATLHQRVLELEEDRERLRSTMHRVTQTCAECRKEADALRSELHAIAWPSLSLGVSNQDYATAWFEGAAIMSRRAQEALQRLSRTETPNEH